MPRDQIQVDEVEGLDVNAVGGAVQPPRIFSLQHRVELRGVVGCEANRRPVPAPSWQRRRCQRQRRRSRRGRARGFCVAEHAWKGGDVFDALGVQLAFARAGSSEVRCKLEGLATRVTRRLAACQRQPPSLVVGADATVGGPARALGAQRDNSWRRARRVRLQFEVWLERRERGRGGRQERRPAVSAAGLQEEPQVDGVKHGGVALLVRVPGVRPHPRLPVRERRLARAGLCPFEEVDQGPPPRGHASMRAAQLARLGQVQVVIGVDPAEHHRRAGALRAGGKLVQPVQEAVGELAGRSLRASAGEALVGEGEPDDDRAGDLGPGEQRSQHRRRRGDGGAGHGRVGEDESVAWVRESRP
mmetsp:Transcript_49434/g.165050  ORF Transcript_49434/g.165050 Transcript_49434/m.165050 type:complete len:359 (+) Transcript_49434:1248-2324(+)